MVRAGSYPAVKQGVRLVTEGQPAEAVQLTAVVEAVFSDGRLELGSLDVEKAALLRPGARVTLEYFREDVVHNLRSSILEVGGPPEQVRTSTRPRILVAPADEVKKIQRRRFPRAFVSLRARYTRVEIPDGPKPGSRREASLFAKWRRLLETEGQDAVADTLSGSGMRLRGDGRLATGEELYMQLTMPDETLSLVGRVVWVGPARPGATSGFSAGIELVHVGEHERQAILVFVSGKRQLP